MASRIIVSEADGSDQPAAAFAVDGPDGATLLATFAGAQVTFNGIENRTECDRCRDNDANYGETSFIDRPDGLIRRNWMGRTAAGTLNQTYHVTLNVGPGTDGTTWCAANGIVKGPTHYLSFCEDCHCLAVSFAGFDINGQPLPDIHASNYGDIKLEVEIQPNGADAGGIAMGAPTDAQVVVRAFCDLTIVTHHAGPGSGLPGANTGIGHPYRIWFFYGTAPLCGLSYPTFTVSNQIEPGIVCFTPDETFYSDSNQPRPNVAGASGGTASVTLLCAARGVSPGNGQAWELDSCGLNCEEGSDDEGSSEEGSGSGDSSGSSGSSGGDGGGGGGSSGSGGDGGGGGGGGSDGDRDEDDEPKFRCFALWSTQYGGGGEGWCFEDTENGEPIFDGVACLDENMMPTTEGWFIEPIGFCHCDESEDPECDEKLPYGTYYRKLSDEPCAGPLECVIHDVGEPPLCPYNIQVPPC